MGRKTRSQLADMGPKAIGRQKLNEHAKADEAYNKSSEGDVGIQSALAPDMVAAQTRGLEEEQAALVGELPGYIKTLVGNGYAKRVFYFEIVECVRKLAIVCVPVFFEAGSATQLLFALIITSVIALIWYFACAEPSEVRMKAAIRSFKPSNFCNSSSRMASFRAMASI